MLYFFMRVYEDEIAYSIFSRHCALNGNISNEYNSQELFGIKTGNYSVFYPSHLDYFIKQLPSYIGITEESIINKNSIFPLFKPFMNIERANTIISKIRNGSTCSIYKEMGVNSGNLITYSGHVIKICKKCFIEEINKNRESYIHRAHQVPGNFICKKHNVYLYEYSVPSVFNKTTFFDINNIDIKSVEANDIEIDLVSYFSDLSEDIEFTLNGGLKDYNIDKIKKKYKVRLQEMGYMNNIRIKQKKLLQDFNKHYPRDLLLKLNSDIDENSNINWIKDAINENSQLVHPIRHLLLIRFLFGSIENLVEYHGSYKPFGTGPWPCLNPISDHYKELVINDYDVKPYGNSSIVGTFKCSCGFVYNRQGPDESEDDKYKIGRIIKYGELWDNKLNDLVMRGDLSISQIAKEMKCAFRTVVKYANILGIIDYLNTKQRIESKSYSKKIGEQEFELYKNNIVKFIDNNPHATREQIKKNLNKEFMLVNIRDRDWLYSVLPEKFREGRKLKRGYTDKEWKELDDEICSLINVAVTEILNEEKNQRITVSLIARKINYTGINKYNILNNLHKSKNKLSIICETVEQYHNRIRNKSS